MDSNLQSNRSTIDVLATPAKAWETPVVEAIEVSGTQEGFNNTATDIDFNLS